MTQELPDYTATVAYLEDLFSRPPLPVEEVGLQRIQALMAALDHPERRFAAIQIGGSAGKGSTATMAAAILRAAGRRTGTFTSPHLQSYRERIIVDGQPIAEAIWVRQLNRLRPILDRLAHNLLPGYSLGRASFTEVLWAMACLAFVEEGIECAAVEVGLGGRVDATTVNAAPVAVITNVSLNHTARLGPTVEAIAAEKAGLIKRDQIVISGACEPALGVIRAACAERGATLWPLGEHGLVRVHAEGAHPDGPFDVRTPLRLHQGLHLRLRGEHQRANAACAVAAVDALALQTGRAVPEAAVAHGLAEASIHGRLEVVAHRPEVVLDGAHSTAGAAALARALPALYPGRRIVLVLGILSDGDKDLEAIAEALSPLAAAVIVTEPPRSRRAGHGEQVAGYARRHSPQVEREPRYHEALARAQALAGPDDVIVVAGSLYLVGAVRDLFLPLDRQAPMP